MSQADSNSPFYIALVVNTFVAYVLWTHLTTGELEGLTVIFSAFYFVLSLLVAVTPFVLDVEQRMEISKLKMRKTPYQRFLTNLSRLVVVTIICLFFTIEHYVTALTWTTGLALCAYVMYTDKKRLKSSQ